MADERSRFSAAITCPNCGQTGDVVWDEATGPDRTRGRQRQLVYISGGFHSETGRTQSGDPLVICDVCDQIQEV